MKYIAAMAAALLACACVQSTLASERQVNKAVQHTGSTSSGVGKPARQILMPKNTCAVRHLSWFPDNRRVAFTLIQRAGKADDKLIAVVDVENGNVAILSDSNIKHCYPVCSPDGQTIAYIGPMGEQSTIWAMDVSGDNKRRIADVSCWRRPVWSPDGKRLAFTVRNNDVWVINVDGSGQKQLTSGPGVGGTQPKWSPNGNLIAFVANDELWLMQADGSNQKVLTRIVSKSGYGTIGEWDDLYDWSPDGKQIVYAYRPIPADGRTVTHDGGIHPYQLWIVNVDGSGKSCLTPDEVSCGNPMWVPGKRHVLFESVYKYVVTAAVTFDSGAVTSESYPDQNLWVLDLAEKGKKQLTNTGTMREFRITLDDGKVGTTRLASMPRSVSEFAVSSDGNSVVFTDGLHFFLLEL